MGRPFAIIGFTMFATLFFVAVLGQTAGIILLIAALCVLLPMLFIKKLKKNAAVILALMSCVFSVLFYSAAYQLFITPQEKFVGREARWSGTVCDYPSYENDCYYYEVKVDAVDGKPLKKAFRLRLCTTEEAGAKPADRLTFHGEIYALGSSGRFTRLNYLSDNCFLGVYATEDVETTAAAAGFHGLECFFAEYRHRIVSAIASLLPADNAALCAAVLTGDKSGISAENLANINRIGISHIICVSGLHLSILASAVIFTLRKLRLPRRLRYGAAAGFVLFFMALCGFTMSVVRAGIMFLVYILSELLLAEPDSRNSLGIATMIVLLNPFAATNIGFIFSFTSTLSIITIGTRANAYCKEKWQISRRNKLIKLCFSLFEIFLISLCVNLFTLPFSVLIFQKISPAGLAANVLILPIATALLVSSALCAVLTLISFHLFAVIIYPFAFVASALSAYVLKIASVLGKMRASSLYLGDRFALIFAAVLLIAAALLLAIKAIAANNKKLYRLTAGICTFVVLLSATLPFALAKPACNVTVHAVSYGMCLSVKTKEEFILIDTAAGNRAYEKVSRDMFAGGVENVDYLVLTSDRVNEAGNASLFVSRLPIKNIILSKNNQFNSVFSQSDVRLMSTDNLQLQFKSGLSLDFYSSKLTAIMLTFRKTKVLIVNSTAFDMSYLPQNMRSFDYLICKGKVHQAIVNSSINGIIEITTKPRQTNPFSAALYSTADRKDIHLSISEKTTKIGSENAWRR